MAEHSHALRRLAVLQLVAGLAERQAIADFESEFGARGERLDMVSMKVAALRVTAVPARELVSLEYRGAPSRVLGATPDPMVFRRDASLPAWVLRTCHSGRITRHRELERRLSVADGELVAAPLSAHQRARLRRMPQPLEARRRRLLRICHARAAVANRLEAVTAASIRGVRRAVLPFLAGAATLQACSQMRGELLVGHADLGSGLLQISLAGPGHELKF